MKIIIKIAGGFDVHISKNGKAVRVLDKFGNELIEDIDYVINEREITKQVECFVPSGLSYTIFYDE